MRINIYAEELTDRIEVVTKAPPNHPDTEFAGIRLYLASPDVLHADPDDDDSSAITIWVPWTRAGGHRPEAVIDLLLSAAGALSDRFGEHEDHVIEFRDDGWTICHTLHERLRGDIFSCPISNWGGGDPGLRGRYVLNLDGTLGDRVDDPGLPG